jgi:iron complex outermembrane recepter protein
MFKKSAVNTGVLAALGSALLFASASSSAQQKPETIVVTGSRIVKSDLVGTTPVVSVGLDQMGNVGIENFADMATQLPQFAPSFGASRTQSTFSGVASSGLNLANLRNLGSARSLVLINGRRAAGGTSTSTSVDFNNIPTANIEKIEIITGGASAVYGSDAVAGVINIITKRSAGVDLSLSYGEAEQGDNKNPSASVYMGGKIGDKGRGSMTFEFDKQGRVSCKDRYICAEDFSWFAPATQVRGPAAQSGVGLGGRFFLGSTSYVRRGDNFLDSNGRLVEWGGAAVDGYNRNADRDIAIPTTRIMAAAELEYEIAAGTKAFGEINYGETNIVAKFEGHPFQSNAAGSRYGTLNPNIPVSNPFIPVPLRNAVNTLNATPGQTPVTEIVWWQRFNDSGGPRGADSNRQMIRTVFGLNGAFDSLGGFGRNFRWELSHTMARTAVNLNTQGLVNTANLYHGLRVEADPGNPGKFRCIDAGARAQGCVPINPFAPYTEEMKKSLRIGSVANGNSRLNDTLATLTGTVADLPAGAARMALGLERRSFSGFLDRDVVVNNALATGNQISDTDFAKTTTDEAFAEVFIPVLAELPGVNQLNLEGAFRNSKTDKVSYNTWNFGGDWEPVEGVRFRYKQARSVRAALPGELSGVGQTFGVVNDPCKASLINTGSASRAAACAAAGVPVGYAPPQTVEQGVAGLSGGNPNLKPEKGDTRTFGIVLTPPQLKGFSLAIDRFEFDISDIITTVSRQDAVNLCYDQGLLCNVVTRGANVQIPGANYVLTAVNEQLENVAKLKVSGIDVDARYNFGLPAGWGAMDLGLTATLYDKALQNTAGTELQLLGQAGGSTTDQGWVRFTANANIGWAWNGLKVNWNMRHIGETNMTEAANKAGYPRIPAVTYHNLRVGYQFNKAAEIAVGVTNIADKQPPFFASGSSGTQALDTIPGYYDVFGRSFFVSAKYKF